MYIFSFIAVGVVTTNGIKVRINEGCKFMPKTGPRPSYARHVLYCLSNTPGPGIFIFKCDFFPIF